MLLCVLSYKTRPPHYTMATLTPTGVCSAQGFSHPSATEIWGGEWTGKRGVVLWTGKGGLWARKRGGGYGREKGGGVMDGKKGGCYGRGVVSGGFYGRGKGGGGLWTGGGGKWRILWTGKRGGVMDGGGKWRILWTGKRGGGYGQGEKRKILWTGKWSRSHIVCSTSAYMEDVCSDFKKIV